MPFGKSVKYKGSVPPEDIRTHKLKSDEESNNNWNIKKPVGYPIFDYPNNLGKKRTISFEDPGEMIDTVKGSYNVSTRDEFVKNAERGYGDDSETTIPEFRELIKSKENILPPIGIEHKPNGRVFFEGRHRLAAAYLEGVKIPTIQVYNATEDEKDTWKQKSFQDKKDYYASQLDLEEPVISEDDDSNNNINKEEELKNIMIQTYNNPELYKTKLDSEGKQKIKRYRQEVERINKKDTNALTDEELEFLNAYSNQQNTRLNHNTIFGNNMKTDSASKNNYTGDKNV